MNLATALLLLEAAILFGPSESPAVTDPLIAAQQIDRLLAEDWRKHGVVSHPPAAEEVLLRRLYLDIAGRIPTLGEAKAYFESRDPRRRVKLIDALLASDGFTSHLYNFWADLLRITSSGGKSKIVAEAWSEWVKRQIKDDRPYDEMVREMLTKHGLACDSGAIGFTARDENPLDHLAFTVQVFLGTQIICAQCHNHPFDKWTQSDYYGIFAYTYGMKHVGESLDILKVSDPSAKAAGFSVRELTEARKSLQSILQPLKYAGTKLDERRSLVLPEDYKYPDAKPGQTVEPKSLFGRDAKPAPGQARVDAFAEWLTSPENPRFTTVIANRMWKRVFGLGLIEPVDDMSDDTVASNPPLLEYLRQLMIEQRYSIRSFLRVLYNTETYQRETARRGVEDGEPWHFTGPLLKRMSAEQVWDSLVTLVRGNVDGDVSETNAALHAYLAALKNLSETIREKGLAGLAEVTRSTRQQQEADRVRIAKLREEMNATGSAGKKAAQELNREEQRLKSQSRDAATAGILGVPNLEGMNLDYKAVLRENKGKNQKMDRVALGNPTGAQRRAALQESAADPFRDRAAELPSPARTGHLLRIFGQSDRELIENASSEFTVPQALILLNGPAVEAVSGAQSHLQREMNTAASPREKMVLVYQALLCRKPTAQEAAVLEEALGERGDEVVKDVLHALLLGGQFLFVQ